MKLNILSLIKDVSNETKPKTSFAIKIIIYVYKIQTRKLNFMLRFFKQNMLSDKTNDTSSKT